MQLRYNLAHLILAIVVTLDLTLLTVNVDAQGRIAFTSERDGRRLDIYVMDADRKNQLNITNNRHDDRYPSWFNSPFSVSAPSKKFTMWGWLKQVDR